VVARGVLGAAGGGCRNAGCFNVSGAKESSSWHLGGKSQASASLRQRKVRKSRDKNVSEIT
jgi:hypothetical protein